MSYLINCLFQLKLLLLMTIKILCLKNERNEWDLPGGKIDFYEDIEECLLREVKEETNLNIKNLKILKPLNIKFNDVTVLILLYSAEISCDSSVTISFEHSEYNFFSKSEIENLIMPIDFKKTIISML